jgi:hypothetical protein
MRTLPARSLAVALAAAALLAFTGCPKGKLPGTPDVPGGIPGGASGKVDPETCGNYAVTDAGRKLKNFLEATVELQTTVTETEEVVKTSCKMMGAELKMPPGDLEGITKDVCARVITELKNDLKVGIKSQAALVIEYKPAICTIDVDAEAHAAAECEAQASGSASVTCEAECTGTCKGTCKGTCEGGNKGGQCDGKCKGTCEGSCSGGCTGKSDVKASAQCKAKAEVHASASVNCTEPSLKITLQKPLVLDASKAELAVNALLKGMPKILSVRARLEPLQGAVAAWVTAATELSKAGNDLAQSFKDQALCISGQIAAAAGMIANINASVSVSVSVSVEASGSAGIK